MTPTLTVFADAPDRGRGLARDMTVRWALEEVDQPYEIRRVSMAELKQPAHLALQPFGQIPTYQQGPLVLFETGAIVLHVAQAHAGLLPPDAAARARAISWMFAAHATVEPLIVERESAAFTERDRPWFAERVAMLDQRLQGRLAPLAARLEHTPWLEDAFGAGDLLMVQALRRLSGSPLLEAHPALVAYVARGQARPAFARAFAAQRAVFLAGVRVAQGDQTAGG
jgi:glutathione S-transferase